MINNNDLQYYKSMYNNLQNINDEKYEQICEILSKLDQKDLKTLAESKIPWLSEMAYNRIY